MASSGQLSGVTAGQGSPSTTPQSRVPAYTTEEKQWLKKNHQDEFHFLRMYSYSIYDEEERAEGRLLVRAFMNDENEGHSQGEQLNGQHNNGDEDVGIQTESALADD